MSALAATPPLLQAALFVCFLLVCAFEFANGFHDTANAVATVIYTNSLKPRIAVVLSAVMNFLGVIIGGIAVAYALVEILPADVLSPPNGSPAVPMLVSLFLTALGWNILTWWFGIPNSSSHCIIGALIGVAIGDALVNARNVGATVDWDQIWNVLRSLAISPVLGFIGAGLLFLLVKHLIRDPHLFEPPEGDRPPAGWVRGLLVLTCTGVSFAHGTNDGQKSIGLIMLTVIGLMPAAFSLNPAADQQIRHLPETARSAAPLIEKYGSDQKKEALDAIQRLEQDGPALASAGANIGSGEGSEGVPSAAGPGAGNGTTAGQSKPAAIRAGIRSDVYQVVSELKQVAKDKGVPADAKAEAGRLRGELRPAVEYAPWWVRVLSALCIGCGTMIGYKRIVQTLGERLGKMHLTPAQGASAELVGAGLIATAGFTGLPVSTTHIITSGVAGTMVGARAGVNRGMIMRIVLAWVLTLPVTIAAAAGLFYLMRSV
ncbi:MAG: inorganic phosphate transporter [Acetobacteraceae bacterium]|nr:inorganic phosphate transporter [Acetobacteraceae bacterium]